MSELGEATLVLRPGQLSMAKVAPGHFYVSREPVQIVTVLGSCVSACIRDPQTGVGGMNHFMLPVGDAEGADAWGDGSSGLNRYGNFAMENLVSGIVKRGGELSRLEVKLFGGGRVLDMTQDVGAMNVNFVLAYLKTKQLPVEAMDVGEDYARKLIYEPHTGVARMKKLRDIYNGYIASTEKRLLDSVRQTPTNPNAEVT